MNAHALGILEFDLAKERIAFTLINYQLLTYLTKIVGD